MVQRKIKGKGYRQGSTAAGVAGTFVMPLTAVISTLPWTAPIAAGIALGASGAYGPSKSAAAGYAPTPRQTKRKNFFDRGHMPSHRGTHFG